jgi:hypothetical protein
VVTRFAAQQGVHPGIVVGRLQYEQQLPFATPLSMLKGSYSWDQEAHD